MLHTRSVDVDDPALQMFNERHELCNRRYTCLNTPVLLDAPVDLFVPRARISEPHAVNDACLASGAFDFGDSVKLVISPLASVTILHVKNEPDTDPTSGVNVVVAGHDLTVEFGAYLILLKLMHTFPTSNVWKAYDLTGHPTMFAGMARGHGHATLSPVHVAFCGYGGDARHTVPLAALMSAGQTDEPLQRSTASQTPAAALHTTLALAATGA